MTIQPEVLAAIQLLIFDLDGTLIDSKTDLVLSVNATRERMGLAPLSAEMVSSYVGRGVTTLIRRSLGEAATDPNVERATAIFLEYYRDHMLDNTVAYAGVREALEELRGRKMAVLTNKPVRFSRAILDGLKMAAYFSHIYGGNSFAQKKPDPVGVLTLMSELTAGPTETMIIGDSDTDVLTGRNASIWTCGVTYGLAPHTLNSTPPDILLHDLRQLPPLLNGHEAARPSGSPSVRKGAPAGPRRGKF
jgi:phosphoglycolate phosphatase